MKLLIVDDSYEIRGVLRSICADLFDKIIECEDGDEAVSAYINEKPDWVLMDIKMKRTDGITATKQIKKYFPEARIIIVSQYIDKAFEESSKQAGAEAFVPKEDLTKVEEIIKNR